MSTYPLCPHQVVYPAIMWGKNILISNENTDWKTLKHMKRKKDFIRLSDNDYGSDDLWIIEKLKSPSQKTRLKITFFNPVFIENDNLEADRSYYFNGKNCFYGKCFYRINK